MNKLYAFVFVSVLLSGCENQVKNSTPKVIEELGTEVTLDSLPKKYLKTPDLIKKEKKSTVELEVLGFWVGYFVPDSLSNASDIMVYADEFVWFRENKINISIDSIVENRVVGHSVVAGNNRPFEGKVIFEENRIFSFKVSEPGNESHDGVFEFSISQGELNGKWKAYNELEIQHRKYSLKKRRYVYLPDIMLDERSLFLDWYKSKEAQPDTLFFDEGDFEVWYKDEFATTTNAIYQINASNTVLTNEDVENLKKSDLRIIRNTIYARHGYSFKNRPLRVFFDAQPWYIPVYSNITKEFSQIELDNIQLLLRYEKNAEEYYDYFGRG
ncbi:YARHG domain-containing protein [Nonlabens dokdonensis]|uniref:YARHG domain-containing protein n=1 Tax=Nonlabens dokdonensis TaxID=328515 RepID=A0A1Z8B6U1_9FLAO|nr:YARHG domain-containing protein [Nonlabens dokdonensis]OUS18267.1 YARHG domain-containing protein [Nonlabens dokdonensis]